LFEYPYLVELSPSETFRTCATNPYSLEHRENRFSRFFYPRLQFGKIPLPGGVAVAVRITFSFKKENVIRTATDGVVALRRTTPAASPPPLPGGE
jgi:hypothetical protein